MTIGPASSVMQPGMSEMSVLGKTTSKIALKDKTAAFTEETMKKFHTHEEEESKFIDKFFKYDSVASTVDRLLAESYQEAKQHEPAKEKKARKKDLIVEKPKKKKKPKPPPEPEPEVDTSESIMTTEITVSSLVPPSVSTTNIC